MLHNVDTLSLFTPAFFLSADPGVLVPLDPFLWVLGRRIGPGEVNSVWARPFASALACSASR
jgi:hypothetical protein